MSDEHPAITKAREDRAIYKRLLDDTLAGRRDIGESDGHSITVSRSKLSERLTGLIEMLDNLIDDEPR